jgi:hypothetical protein
MINEIVDSIKKEWPPSVKSRSELPVLSTRELVKVSEQTGIEVPELAFYFQECWRD